MNYNIPAFHIWRNSPVSGEMSFYPVSGSGIHQHYLKKLTIAQSSAYYNLCVDMFHRIYVVADFDPNGEWTRFYAK